jgi:hypothetical protein
VNALNGQWIFVRFWSSACICGAGWAFGERELHPRQEWEQSMTLKMLAVSAAAIAALAGGAAHAQSYYGPTPPYGSGAPAGAYGYAGSAGDACGFTLAGVHAGFTVLGIDVDGGARARIGGECGGGYTGAAYAPPPSYPAPYQDTGYYNEPPYPATPTYPQPAYGYGPSCGCQGVMGYRPY